MNSLIEVGTIVERQQKLLKPTRMIAWGTSKLLKMHLKNSKAHPFAYCIDNFTDQKDVYGLEIKRSTALESEKPGTFRIVIFAVSNHSLQAIFSTLFNLGLRYGQDFILYSDYFYAEFVPKAEKCLGWKVDPRIYQYAVSYTLNSRTPLHTTILGTWMFLEILKATNRLEGAIAELGIFQGGNALCSLNFMHSLNPKTMYLFDSFDGFPELSVYDPASQKKGDYKVQSSVQEIISNFDVFPEAKIIKGFIPQTFAMVPAQEKFSLAFYDCDLYQPALDTYEFFWNRLTPGGFLIIHDYEAEEGGFSGVKKATHEFFDPLKVSITSFYENTMAIIRKQK